MRKSVLLLAIIVLTLTLVAAQKNTGKKMQSSDQAGRTTSKTPKGKLLVDRLPDGVEGVTLEKHSIKLKPGYKFVRKSPKTIAVTRMVNSTPQTADGSFECSCSDGEGGCSAVVNGQEMICVSTKQAPCKEHCDLIVIFGNKSKGLIIY